MRVKDLIGIVVAVGGLALTAGIAYYTQFRELDELRFHLVRDDMRLRYDWTANQSALEGSLTISLTNSGNRPLLVKSMALRLVQIPDAPEFEYNCRAFGAIAEEVPLGTDSFLVKSGEPQLKKLQVRAPVPRIKNWPPKDSKRVAMVPCLTFDVATSDASHVVDVALLAYDWDAKAGRPTPPDLIPVGLAHNGAAPVVLLRKARPW